LRGLGGNQRKEAIPTTLKRKFQGHSLGKGWKLEREVELKDTRRLDLCKERKQGGRKAKRRSKMPKAHVAGTILEIQGEPKNGVVKEAKNKVGMSGKEKQVGIDGSLGTENRRNMRKIQT